MDGSLHVMCRASNPLVGRTQPLVVTRRAVLVFIAAIGARKRPPSASQESDNRDGLCARPDQLKDGRSVRLFNLLEDHNRRERLSID